VSDNTLQKRIIIDLGLIDDVRQAIINLKTELISHKTPLRPDRRNDLLAALKLLQGDSDDPC
jgi:hypothetical protein